MKKYDKNRLLEVMQKTDPTFKPKLNEEFSTDGAEAPQTEEQKFEELANTYINGNISFFVNELKQMETGEIVRFLRWAQENNIKF
jgi:hypothetical protein